MDDNCKFLINYTNSLFCLIEGAVWIFPAKTDVQFDDDTLPTYCERSTFDYAFGLVITQICLGSIIEFVLICSLFLVAWDRYSAY